MATMRAALSPFGVRQVFPQILSGSQTSATRSLLRLPFSSASSLPNQYFGATVSSTVSSLLGDIWESILRAVPKKKVSHMKGRSRRMAGKALQDATDINSCSSCGEPKRSHLLCPTCVSEVKKNWRQTESKDEKATA